MPLDQKVYEGKENTEFILNDTLSTHNPKHDKHKIISKTSEKNNILQEKAEDKDTDNNTDQDPISVLVVEDNAELRNFLSDTFPEPIKSLRQRMDKKAWSGLYNMYRILSSVT